MEEISKHSPMSMEVSQWRDRIGYLRSFVLQLSHEDRCRLYLDDGFREIILDGFVFEMQTQHILRAIRQDEMKFLFDEDFWYMCQGGFHHIFKAMHYTDIEYLFETNPMWINIEAVTSCDNYKLFSDEWRMKILDMAISTKEVKLIRCAMKDYFNEPYKTEMVLDYSKNKEVLAHLNLLLKNKNIANIFFHDETLNFDLDPDNRYRLYEGVSFEKLTNEDKMILEKLLYNAMALNLRLPDTILLDEGFIEYIVGNGLGSGWNYFKGILLNLEEIHPEVCARLKARYQERADLLIDKFMDSSNLADFYDADHYGLGGIEHIKDKKLNFRDFVFKRYFDTIASDVYITASLIWDSITYLPGFMEQLCPKLIELVERMVMTIIDEFGPGSIISPNLVQMVDRESFDNVKEIITILRSRNDWRALFKDAVKLARTEFSKNLTSSLYMPNLDKARVEDGVTIVDITEVEDFHLLVHDEEVKDAEFCIPGINKDIDMDISMSLLDNGHMTTYATSLCGWHDHTNITFGYSRVPVESIIHAMPGDSFTEYCTKDKGIRKRCLIEATTTYLPTYIDIDNFMRQTVRTSYNEIKVRAKVNGENLQGEPAFVPQYILSRDNITDKQKEVARKLNIPIVFVDTHKLFELNSERKRGEEFTPRPKLMMKRLLGRYTSFGLEDSTILK